MDRQWDRHYDRRTTPEWEEVPNGSAIADRLRVREVHFSSSIEQNTEYVNSTHAAIDGWVIESGAVTHWGRCMSCPRLDVHIQLKADAARNPPVIPRLPP